MKAFALRMLLFIAVDEVNGRLTVDVEAKADMHGHVQVGDCLQY